MSKENWEKYIRRQLMKKMFLGAGVTLAFTIFSVIFVLSLITKGLNFGLGIYAFEVVYLFIMLFAIYLAFRDMNRCRMDLNRADLQEEFGLVVDITKKGRLVFEFSDKEHFMVVPKEIISDSALKEGKKIKLVFGKRSKVVVQIK